MIPVGQKVVSSGVLLEVIFGTEKMVKPFASLGKLSDPSLLYYCT